MYIKMPSKFALVYIFLQETFVKDLFVPDFMLSLSNIKIEMMAFSVKEQIEGDEHMK